MRLLYPEINVMQIAFKVALGHFAHPPHSCSGFAPPLKHLGGLTAIKLLKAGQASYVQPKQQAWWSGVQEVAVKLLPLAGASEGEVKVVLREAVALARASEYCKYASRLLGMCRKDGNFCLVMKKYAGSLSSKLNTYAGMDASS